MIINATIQVVPLTNIAEAFPIVDEAIALIQKSGITYTVSPFETILEGEYDEVQALLRQVEDFCYQRQQPQFLIYTKMHVSGASHIFADDKTAKFRHE